VLVAIPGGLIAEAFESMTGVEGKTMIDATNRIGVGAPAGFTSNAEFVKSRTGGPTAKSFNVNFRVVAAPARRGPGPAEQPLVRRRGGTRGRRTAEPRRWL
jgi:hypothetical protein